MIYLIKFFITQNIRPAKGQLLIIVVFTSCDLEPFPLASTTSNAIPNCDCPNSIIDNRDGKVYLSTWIDIDGGNDNTKDGQCWMKENLNYSLNVNEFGDQFCYKDSIVFCVRYGSLYTWAAATQNDVKPGIQGICPDGWRLPTEEDFNRLLNSVENSSGLTIQCGGTGLTNGFAALFGGYRRLSGQFTNNIDDVVTDCEGVQTVYWTSTKPSMNARSFLIYKNVGPNIVATYSLDETGGGKAFSIRCICNQ